MALQAKHQEINFSVGDNVKVHQKIIEGDKERIYVFEGVVIGIRGRGENKSFTVRRIATGNIGVERIWPLNSPWLVKIEVMRRGKVRKAKLYYLRKRKGKKAVRIKARYEKESSSKTKKTAKVKKESTAKRGSGKKGRETRRKTPQK